MSIWRRFFWLDAPAGLVAVLILSRVRDVGVLHDGDADGFYGSVIQACGGVTAFIAAAIAIVLALAPGTRLKALLGAAVNRNQLRRSMAWASAVNLGACAVALIGLTLDDAHEPHIALRKIAIGSSLAGIAATFRALWMFVSILAVHDTDASGNDRVH